VLLPLPKKGCLSDCNNWRGITLMSVPGKTFCTVLLNRLNSEVDRLLREEQAGFRHGRSCSEQIFHNIMEQCREFQTPLFVNYIDFKKAFDSIHRESLWKILKLYGIPDKFINIFKSLYRHTNCCEDTRWSHQPVWRHHRCASRLHPFAPVVPNLHWLRHEKGTVRHLTSATSSVRQRHWSLFSTYWRFTSQIIIIIIIIIIYELPRVWNSLGPWQVDWPGLRGWRCTAESLCHNATADDRQPEYHRGEGRVTDKLWKIQGVNGWCNNSHPNNNWSTSIGGRKGVPVSGEHHLHRVRRWGWYPSENRQGSIHLPTSSENMVKPLHQPWHQTSAVHVHSHPNCASRLWDLEEHIQHTAETILGISWRDHISNDEVLRRVDLGSLSEIVRQRRLRFAGHILRLPENRPAYKAMNWLLDNGKRRPGRPTKTWRATFKEDLQDMGLTWMGAKRSASDRLKWRKLVARCSGRNWRN